MHILYLAQTYPPEPGATKRPARQAAAWVRAGHAVTVITAMPSYPMGERLPGYRGRMVLRERIDGVEVVRVPSLASPNVGLARRGLSFASFAVTATLAGLGVARPDIVIGSIPKPGTELAALALARRYACPLVLEVRDVLPRTLLRSEMLTTKPAYVAIESAYAVVYRSAARLAVTEQAAAAQLIELGVSPDKIVSWPHAWDACDLADDAAGARVRAELGWADAFVVAYAGSFSAIYHVPEMVAAARRLQSRVPQLRLLLIGAGAMLAQVREHARDLTNVHVTGGIEPGAVGPYLRAADMFLWPAVNDDPLGGTKIIEYLAVGRPVLALQGHVGAGPALARIGAGEGVAFDDAAAVDQALMSWAASPERRRDAAMHARTHVAQRERAQVAAAALEDLRRLI